MIIARSVKNVVNIIKKVRGEKKTIGFVPTMGALHHGHLSLVKAAKNDCDFVVVSIFVNPTQFGPKEDYKKYPRTFKKDKELLEKEKVDLVFYPTVKSMYPKSFSTYVEEVFLSKVLCGKSRPGHFRGVCTVVTKLFNIVQPDVAYFGQKDYQQAQIIKRMVVDLNFQIKIKVLPIVRENDGLAASSRNVYLNDTQRKQATILFRALNLAKQLIKQGTKDPNAIIEKMRKLILSQSFAKIDYIKIVDPKTLRDVKEIKKKVVVALAVFIGKTRLIDNIIV
ncbi:MAG: pantoate--beta-alanine ligase [Candidatus Omnitrophica bacterium]|nr:pantoate--beta-alanine ligase [Candidatus Omnitrophota bacterium]